MWLGVLCVRLFVICLSLVFVKFFLVLRVLVVR